MRAKSQFLIDNRFNIVKKLDELKEFLCSKLKVDGSWSSPAGDVKLFIG